LADLFCGCGGLTLGAWEAARLSSRRLDIRLAIDASTTAIKVYRNNFAVTADRCIASKVESIFDRKKGSPPSASESTWIQRIGKLDIIVAGPPCQGHSDLNNSTRRNDPRNSLYLRVARAVELTDPKVVLIENVPTVVHDSRGVVRKTRSWLQELGYFVSDAVVNFGQFGIPQLRKRHILVGVRDKLVDLPMLKALETTPPSVGEFLAGLENEPESATEAFYQPANVTPINRRRIDYLFKQNVFDLPDRLRPSCHRDKVHAYVSMYGRMHWDRPAQTLTSGFGSMGQGRYVHPRKKRLVTPHEAARLQGFPDFFDFSSVGKVTALREMIANAVPPQFTAVLIRNLIEAGIF
jgi:DNA (cytosine-5)-methyltransferase 1